MRDAVVTGSSSHARMSKYERETGRLLVKTKLCRARLPISIRRSSHIWLSSFTTRTSVYTWPLPSTTGRLSKSVNRALLVGNTCSRNSYEACKELTPGTGISQYVSGTKPSEMTDTHSGVVGDARDQHRHGMAPRWFHLSVILYPHLHMADHRRHVHY